jgi:hypothetical protein
MLIVSLDRDLGSSRLLGCSTVPQNLTSGRHSERLTPKSLILEVIGLGRMGPIFMAASCSQDVTRPIHQDPTRGSPRGYCDDRLDYARTMRPSARRPPEPRPGLHSARPQSTACGRAQRSRSGGSARVHCRRGCGTNGLRCSLADVAAITSILVLRRRGLPALEMPGSWSTVPLRHGVGPSPA